MWNSITLADLLMINRCNTKGQSDHTLERKRWKGTPLSLAKAHNCLDEVVAWLIDVKVNWKHIKTVSAMVAA